MVTSTRVALRLAYLGGGFAGWQKQRGQRTVQGELERALERLYGSPVRTTGAGRTDAGVHAAGQVVHFDPPRGIPPAGVQAALNSMLAADARVVAAWTAPPGFDARRSARGKRYRYRLAWGPPLDPWEGQRTWLLPAPPGVEALSAGGELLVGEHDFAAFALSGHAGTGRRGTVRCVSSLRVVARGRRAAIVVEGDGFLRGMVRRFAGALVEVGRGGQPIEWLDALLRDPRTRPPAPTAPAHGLTLERVFY